MTHKKGTGRQMGVFAIKKWVSAVVLTALLGSGAGCSGPETVDESREGKSAISVSVTLPVDFWEGVTEQEVIRRAGEQGIDEVTLNDDGSLTFTMTEDERKALCEDFLVRFERRVADITGKTAVSAPEETQTFSAIEHNKDFSEITVACNGMYAQGDGFILLELLLSAGYYQLLNGVEPEALDVVVDIVDAYSERSIERISIKELLGEEADIDS